MLEFIQHIHWAVVFQIILIDILLGGDNAIIIALACRNLEKHQRMKGILWGTVGAIVMRVILIAFAMTLLTIPYLKIIGALLLIWIGIKLVVPQEEHHEVQASTNVWGAVKTILIADLVMSFDNVIGIAGAADNTPEGHAIYYVIFGLVVSVPIIIWGSTIVLKIIDRFPWVVVFGAGILGWIAGGLLITDVAVVNHVFGGSSADGNIKLMVEAIGAAVVVVTGLILTRSAKAKATKAE